MTIKLVSEIKREILAPIKKSHKDINDYSAVVKITCENSTFLLAGDATNISEAEIIEKYSSKLKADALKAGHHGNEDSSSKAF
jgi:competence protein ComEC